MRAYERLLKYVKVHTTSDPNSGTHPSTLRQFDLAKILVEELKELGLTDAHVDEHCYVYATLPATPGQESAAPLGLIAHMDTADDASGENVRPQIHENYDGEAVTLPATGTVLDPKVFPFLREMKGQTLITTDGSTLLGADDKAGVAEIMTALERIIAERDATWQRIRNDWVFRLAALGALVISLLEVISSYTGLEIAFLSHLPLASLGFAWVVPALLCGVIGHFIPHGKKKSLAS